ncbi:MAG: two-component regulator propeller domain-containing protein, partial [Sphingomonadaceae bacterium]
MLTLASRRLLLATLLLWAQLAWAAPATLFAQADLDFETIADAESLPSAVITVLTQDARGWLWIGTPNGLMRYDGYRLRRFPLRHGATPSLASDTVSVLWNGSDGRLWVGTNNDGLFVLDPGTEQAISYRTSASSATPATVSQAGGKIWALAGDAGGGVWVGANDGLDYWAPGASAPQRFRHDPARPGSLTDNRIRSLLVDRHGTLWVGTAAGLLRRPARATSFERVASDPADPASLAGQDIRVLFEAADGKLWIGTREQGAAWIAAGSSTLQRVQLDPDHTERVPHRFVRSIAQAGPDQIWLGMFDASGINIVDAGDGHLLQRARHDPSVPGSLTLDSINSLLVDRAGLVWVGTWGNGLQRHQPANHAIQLLHHSPARATGLSHGDIRSVLERADGSILAGTGGNGIDILDRRLGLIGGYRPQPGQPGALGDGTISALAETPDGSLWAGTSQAGLFRLPPRSKRWQQFASAEGLPNNNVRRLLVAGDGTLWASTDAGIARWLPSQRRFDTVASTQGGAAPVVYALLEDSAGNLWAGTNAGLALKTADSATLQMLHCAPAVTDCTASAHINGLLIDRDGRLWLASSKGLGRLEQRHGSEVSFTDMGALGGKPGKYPGANLLQDSSGRIWTQWMVFDPATQQLVELTRADGINIGTAWDRAYSTTRDGLFLFGGTQGLAVINPLRFQPWSFQPAVQASEVMIDGSAVPWSRLMPKLVLAPHERNLTITFAAQDYSAPMKNRFAYRLQGYDRDWIEGDADHRSANYGNLWHGNYTLQVRTSNRNGMWSPHQLSIPIEVQPVFWKTTWFLILLLVAVVGAVFLSFRWRVARLRARAAQLTELVRQRTAELEVKNAELQQLAITDRLTGLYNRLKIDQVLDSECARSARFGQPFSLLLLDLDRFKLVNDIHGHQAGDQVLVAMAQVLTQHLRSVDLVGRWGGEEFMVIARGTTLDGAAALAEKLRRAIEQHDFPV